MLNTYCAHVSCPRNRENCSQLISLRSYSTILFRLYLLCDCKLSNYTFCLPWVVQLHFTISVSSQNITVDSYLAKKREKKELGNM